MTTRLLLCLLLLSGLPATGQGVGPYRMPTSIIDIAELKNDPDINFNVQTSRGIYHHWHEGCDERLPVFKGGNDSLAAFLKRNAQWPDSLAYSIRGTVYVRFTIDELGNTLSLRVVQSLHPLADAEALRLVRLMSGRFTPGSFDGRALAVETTLPVTFSGPDAKSGNLNR